jgi:hypothetical protein
LRIVDPPFLDHVSLTAETARVEGLGLRLSPTGGDGSHARVLFERSYLEVTPPAGTAAAELGARGWFLRPADPGEAAEALRSAGISAVGPGAYEGADGTWLDLRIEPASPALPILTQRLDMPADEWPPPRGSSHANGATRLSAVHLESEDPVLVGRVLETLGARPRGDGRFELGGGGGVIVRESRAGREGVVALDLARADRPPVRLHLTPVCSAEE